MESLRNNPEDKVQEYINELLDHWETLPPSEEFAEQAIKCNKYFVLFYRLHKMALEMEELTRNGEILRDRENKDS